MCTGARYLAEAGLLDGRRATTYPGPATSFRRGTRRRPYGQLAFDKNRLTVRAHYVFAESSGRFTGPFRDQNGNRCECAGS